MHTDELRAELAELAQEVDSFAGEVDAVRRRVSRRRTARAIVATVAVVAVLGAAAALTRPQARKVHVAHSAKNVAPEQLRAFDAAVVLPAGATVDDALRVQAVLDNTAAVLRYASLPAATLAFDLGNNRAPTAKDLRTRVCANPSTLSFAVTLAHAVPAALENLTAAIGANATVLSFTNGVSDVEVFMRAKASSAEVAAVRDQIASDPDVVKTTFLDHQAAFEEFKRLFADQPVLIENETPEVLPESFRLDIRDGVPLDTFALRFQNMAGVNQVIVRDTSFWWPLLPAPAGDLEVFMQVKATDAQTLAVREQLKHDPRVESYRFIDRADAYDEFRRLFANLGEGTGGTTPADQMMSFSVALNNPGDPAAFERDYKAIAGVRTVSVSEGGLAEICAYRHL